jgi:hypothetical protein
MIMTALRAAMSLSSDEQPLAFRPTRPHNPHPEERREAARLESGEVVFAL